MNFKLFQSVIRGFCRIRANNEKAASKRKQTAKTSQDPVLITLTDAECEAVVNELKTIMVSAENISEIEEKLVLTLAYRQKMINEQMDLDLLATFPYFFSDPQLVRKNILTESSIVLIIFELS